MVAVSCTSCIAGSEPDIVAVPARELSGNTGALEGVMVVAIRRVRRLNGESTAEGTSDGTGWNCTGCALGTVKQHVPYTSDVCNNFDNTRRTYQHGTVKSARR